MKAIYKRLIAVVAMCVILVLAATFVTKHTLFDSDETTKKVEESTEEIEVNVKDLSADMIFWYDDASYTSFFERAANAYYEDTGKIVCVQYIDSLDYLEDIYQGTMADSVYPDVYLLSGEELEEAYLYGLAAFNTSEDVYKNAVAENAVVASSYNEKMYAYPLSYNTSLFVYQNDYFETAPTSLEDIINYSNENEPPENVEYLLEWDINDPFYDFPIISNSVNFERTEARKLSITYNETLYNSDLEFLQGMLESFSVDAATVSEESIISNFLNGETLCAILDTDAMAELSGYAYNYTELLKLNDSLPVQACALTDLVIVNEFAKDTAGAAEFAEYLTLTMSEELHGMSGHYSVKLSDDANDMEKVAYSAYENSILAPNSQDARDFWVKLKETIAQYF